MGQGRYEYCFSVDGTWTHDPDLPTIKNSQVAQFNSSVVVSLLIFQGCYNNLLKIVDAKDIVANKAANVEKVEEATKLGVANFVEKCFSDATLHETVQREKLFSAGSFSNFSSNFSENGDQCSEGSDDFDDFPDLDEALDMGNPIFITESPLPNRSLKMSENVVTETHNPPRRQDTWQNALDCIVMHSQSMSSVFSNSNLQLASPTPPVSIATSPVSNLTPNSPFGRLTPTPSLEVTTQTPQDVVPEGVSPSSRSTVPSGVTSSDVPSSGIPSSGVPSSVIPSSGVPSSGVPSSVVPPSNSIAPLKESLPTPSQAFCHAPTIPLADTATSSVENSQFHDLNSSMPTLHSADDRLTADGKRFAEKECKEESKGGERKTEPLLRMLEVELSMGKFKSDSMSLQKDPINKPEIDSGKKICSPMEQQQEYTVKEGSGSVNVEEKEEDSSVSVENVDLCPVDAIGPTPAKSEPSQLSGGVPQTGDDLLVQLDCEVPVTKRNVIESAVENKDLEVTGYICEKDCAPDKQVHPENESSAEAGNPGSAKELPNENSSDSQSCPGKTSDRKSDEIEVKHELTNADQVNLDRGDEKPKSTLQDEISNKYVNDNSAEESKEVTGQSEESQKAQSSKLIDEMLISNLNAMEKQRDQTLEEKEKATTKVVSAAIEPEKEHEHEVTKDAFEKSGQVLSDQTKATSQTFEEKEKATTRTTELAKQDGGVTIEEPVQWLSGQEKTTSLEEKEKAVSAETEPEKEGVIKEPLVQVASEATVVGHSIDDVKTFSSSATEKKSSATENTSSASEKTSSASEKPSSATEKSISSTEKKTGESPSSAEEKKTETKETIEHPEVVEAVPIMSTGEKSNEAQNTAIEQKESISQKNYTDVQNELNCENPVEIQSAEEDCSKTGVTAVEFTVPVSGKDEASTDIPEVQMEVTVPVSGLEQISADIPNVIGDAVTNVTNEAEYNSLRIEEVSRPSEIEDKADSESQKLSVNKSAGDLDSEVFPTPVSASEMSGEISEVTSTNVEMASDKKEDPSVQIVLPSDKNENPPVQMKSESDKIEESSEGLSVQPEADAKLTGVKEKNVKEAEIENIGSKSECVTPLLIKSDTMEKSLKGEAVSATESKNQFINGSVLHVKTKDATDPKSTAPNSDIKTEIKTEEFKNVSKRKEKKASKFNFVKKLKKLVPLSVDSKVHSACLVFFLDFGPAHHFEL